jgi:hypothetical protein
MLECYVPLAIFFPSNDIVIFAPPAKKKGEKKDIEKSQMKRF